MDIEYLTVKRMTWLWMQRVVTYQPGHNENHGEEQRIVEVDRCDVVQEQVCLFGEKEKTVWDLMMVVMRIQRKGDNGVEGVSGDKGEGDSVCGIRLSLDSGNMGGRDDCGGVKCG